MMATESVAAVLGFWFGPPGDDAEVAARQSRLWWAKDPALDRAVAARFGPWVEAAAVGRLDDWADGPAGCLALVLLLDQFPRNIWRGTARAFACDALARTWALAAIDRNWDQLLRPIERIFLYLPLEHAESLDCQERSVRLFAAVAEAAPAGAVDAFAGFLDYARRHRDIIARFGRFPHRNIIVGRPSTLAEIAFLGEPGSSF